LKTEELIKEQKETLDNESLKYYFPSDISKGLYLEKNTNYLERIAEGSKDLEEIIYALNNSSTTYLTYYVYSELILKDKELINNNFAISAMYGILTIQLANELKNIDIKINQNNLALYFSQSILCNWEDDTKSLFEIIKLNLNKKDDSIILDNDILNVNLDFILNLYSKMTNQDVLNKDTNKLFTLPVYNQVLDKCFSKDLKEVDLLINLMCEAHLEFIEEDEIYSSFNTKLFTYEILVWLNLRKKHGYENPKEFSHPLINYNINQIYKIKNSNKPYNMPYGIVLLNKLKSKYQNLNIDESFFYEEERKQNIRINEKNKWR